MSESPEKSLQQIGAGKKNALSRPSIRGKGDAGASNRRRHLFSPLVQASAPRAVRGVIASATLGKPLIRECLFYPQQHLWMLSGQWPVCNAGASPTEDLTNLRCPLLPFRMGCQEKNTLKFSGGRFRTHSSPDPENNIQAPKYN